MTKNELILSGKHLKALRQHANKSSKEMANAVQVKEATYLKWEEGKESPDISQFLTLAKFCGLNSVTPLQDELKEIKHRYAKDKSA